MALVFTLPDGMVSARAFLPASSILFRSEIRFLLQGADMLGIERIAAASGPMQQADRGTFASSMRRVANRLASSPSTPVAGRGDRAVVASRARMLRLTVEVRGPQQHHLGAQAPKSHRTVPDRQAVAVFGHRAGRLR
jgi:hypothetical protein